jgi:hypothetical protein
MTITLKERQKINHELKTLGFGGLEDRNLFAQIATLYTTHDSFRGLLMSTTPDQRKIAYEAIRPHLRFVAKPLDVYEREIKEKAEREKWDIYDGTAYPKPFKTGEIESAEYKLDKVAQEAIEATEWEKAKGALEMVCTKCTIAQWFPAAKRREALKAAHDAGWRWDERNGVKRTYCPEHVPGRAAMVLTCSNCERPTKIRVWDEQDGYRDARLLGWVFSDEKCHCPKCAAPRVVLQ